MNDRDYFKEWWSRFRHEHSNWYLMSLEELLQHAFIGGSSLVWAGTLKEDTDRITGKVEDENQGNLLQGFDEFCNSHCIFGGDKWIASCIWEYQQIKINNLKAEIARLKYKQDIREEINELSGV